MTEFLIWITFFTNHINIMKKLCTLYVLLLLAIPHISSAQKNLADLIVRPVITDIQVPWEMRWGPDGWIWTTGIEGRILRVNPTNGESTVLYEQTGVTRSAESGMHGFDIVTNDIGETDVYVSYTYTESSKIYLRIIKLKYNQINVTLTNPTTIIEKIGAGTTHSGCRVKYMPDNTLLITSGDGRIQPQPSQNIASWSGKTLRINLDGSFPQDNPFPNSPVWSWGHRNHQGLCIGRNGIIYSSEHGETTEDEVNILTKAANYGWPAVEGYCNLPQEKKFCADSNVHEPIAGFSPTLGLAGLEYCDNNKFPDWRNSLLLSSLKGNSLHVLHLNENGDSVIKRTNINMGLGRLRSVCVSPQGRVFIGRSQGDHYGTKSTKENGIYELTSKISDTNDDTPQNNGEITIKTQNNLLTIISSTQLEWNAKIYDITGRIVQQLQGNNNLSMPLHVLSQGVYFITIHQNNNILTQSFLVSE